MNGILKKSAAAAAVAMAAGGTSAAAQHPWGVIDARALEILVQSEVPVEVLDARTDQWFDGSAIQSARRLPMDSSERTVREALPHKDQLIVVYCYGPECPASKNLAKLLVSLGYANILDYHEGVKEWQALGKPIQNL